VHWVCLFGAKFHSRGFYTEEMVSEHMYRLETGSVESSKLSSYCTEQQTVSLLEIKVHHFCLHRIIYCTFSTFRKYMFNTYILHKGRVRGHNPSQLHMSESPTWMHWHIASGAHEYHKRSTGDTLKFTWGVFLGKLSLHFSNWPKLLLKYWH